MYLPYSIKFSFTEAGLWQRKQYSFGVLSCIGMSDNDIVRTRLGGLDTVVESSGVSSDSMRF